MILLNRLASRGETSKRNAVTTRMCNHRVMIGVVKEIDGGVCRSQVSRQIPTARYTGELWQTGRPSLCGYPHAHDQEGTVSQEQVIRHSQS